MPVASESLEQISVGGGGGRDRSRWGRRGGGGDDGRRREGEDNEFRHRAGMYRIGIWIALAPIVMFFAAFCSAYIVRRGLSNDWVPVALPAILWLNTAFLVASSIALEQARGALHNGLAAPFNRWWSATLVLGMAFLAGQWLAWRELAARGVYISTNPSGSFFYLLTAAHGLHLFGGELALGYVAVQSLRLGAGPERQISVDVTRVYWHFMGGLWLFLFLMLNVWR